MARKTELSADERLENRFNLLWESDPNPDLLLPDISHLGVDIRLWDELYEFGVPTPRQLSQLVETAAAAAAAAAAAVSAIAVAAVVAASSSQQPAVAYDDITLFL